MLLRAAATAAFFAVSFSALAADSGPYVYGGIGIAHSKRQSQADKALFNSGITALDSHADDNDTSYKLQGGYRFNRYLSIEGGYVDFGRYNYKAASSAPVIATRDGHVGTDAWNAGVVGTLPIGDRFALSAKLGAFRYDLEYHCTGTGITCRNPKRDDHGNRLYYGVAADWNAIGNWFLRAEYEVFQNVGERFNTTGTTGTSRADIKVGTLGLGYRF